MIEQLLNRQFVLGQLEAIRSHLETPPASMPGAPAPGFDGAALLGALRDEVIAAETRELAHSSGQHGGLGRPSERRSRAVPPIDDVAFFSRDPLVSLTQSVLEEYLESERPDLVETTEAPLAGRRGRGSEAGVRSGLVTDRSLKGAVVDRRGEGRRLFGPFEMADPRWVASALAIGLRLSRGRHPFNPKPATPRRMSNQARLVLVGDWGTGLPRARQVAIQMRRVLEQGLAAGLDQHVVHLGDVYYSGLANEYRKRFLPFWPVDATEADSVGSWSLNANHDMYSGGHGYFDVLLRDPRFSGHESSSFFSLHNDTWEVLGLDTGWEEGGLHDPQPGWVEERLRAGGRKGILLSHHQLFSTLEEAGGALETRLRGVLDARRVRAWFWGHEHRCVLYGPHRLVDAARCIGHGGVPVYMWRRPEDPCEPPAEYEYRGRIQDGLQYWARFGFAVLDFDGDRLRVRYIDERGHEHKSEELG